MQTEHSSTDNKQIELLRIAQLAVQHSGGRLRIVKNEEDATADEARDAAHFLKLDDRRLGRDLALYGFMSRVMGWEQALPMFLGEVVMPLRWVLPESYTHASEALKALGGTVYAEDVLPEWNGLFA